MLTLQQIAHALVGEVSGDQVRAPEPGHSAKDRSLSIKLGGSAPDGFLVHSFAGDDPICCKDCVRAKLGLPAWSASIGGSANGQSIIWTYDYRNESWRVALPGGALFPKELSPAST
jgi:hypothetical protein